jgi:hypothetical protein
MNTTPFSLRIFDVDGGMRYVGEGVFTNTIQSSTNLEEQP